MYHSMNYNELNDPNKNNPSTPNPNGTGNGPATPGGNGGSGNGSGNGPANPQNTNTNPQPNSNQVPETLIDYYALAQQNKLHHVQFRETITKRLLTTLTTKNHPNALLVGEAGTGKTAIVEDLALKLYEQDPLAQAMLGKETRIYELPLNNLVAGSSMMGATEAKVKEVLEFITNPNNHAILYIDEIHQLMTNNNLKNVAEILKPALSHGDFHTIGSTTTQELKFWRQNPALNRRFSNVVVNELSDDQTLTVLKQSVDRLQEPNHMVSINPELFKTVINVGNQYAQSLSTHRPDSAITILDQALAKARLQNFELQQTAKLNVPAKLTKTLIENAGKQLLNDDSETLNQETVKKLQATLNANIVGQEKAKQTLVKAIQSMVLNLVPQTKPHSFLFAGLTGTGKTEIAKQLAQVMFGSKDRYLYLNMTEYANRGSITSLIGSSRGYIGSDSAQPLPLDALKSNPTQIVVLDEFEKADMQVRKLFMQALDEGALHYADGSMVDFSHAIVIATTNAGTKTFEEKHVGFNNETEVSNQDLTTALANSFPIELLNRFENVISFNPISKAQYQEILVIKYNHLMTVIEKNHPELKLEPKVATTDMEFIQTLADKSYNQLKNARPAERSIKHFVEAQLLAHPTQTQFDFNQVAPKDDPDKTVDTKVEEPQTEDETKKG